MSTDPLLTGRSAKLVANIGFLIAEIVVIVLGTTAGSVPKWLTGTLTICALVVIFIACIANYAEGLDRGAELGRDGPR